MPRVFMRNPATTILQEGPAREADLGELDGRKSLGGHLLGSRGSRPRPAAAGGQARRFRLRRVLCALWEWTDGWFLTRQADTPCVLGGTCGGCVCAAGGCDGGICRVRGACPAAALVLPAAAHDLTATAAQII